MHFMAISGTLRYAKQRTKCCAESEKGKEEKSYIKGGRQSKEIDDNLYNNLLILTSNEVS